MKSMFFLGNSCHYCRVEHAGGIVHLLGCTLQQQEYAQTCASACFSYRNNKIHIRAEVTQSEGGNFLKSTVGEHNRAHKLTWCHLVFLLLLHLSVNKCSSSWI